jgi:hypothetical protein
VIPEVNESGLKNKLRDISEANEDESIKEEVPDYLPWSKNYQRGRYISEPAQN